MTFFQKIPNEQFNPEEDFIVKESTGMNILISFFFLLIAFFSASMYWWLCGFFLIPGVLLLIKAYKNDIIMIVNKNGFYYYGNLITNWSNFIDVEFIDEVPLPDQNSSGVSDKFSMLIKFYKDGQPGLYFTQQFPFTNTQDKSEEEIIAAIKFYHQYYKTKLV
jgi:hypothetical protein